MEVKAPSPVTLRGTHVRLEPLSLDHLDGLCEDSLAPALWQWTIVQVTTRDQMRAFIEQALSAQDSGSAVPFAIIDRASGRVAGCTRFMNIDTAHKHLEIGSTFVTEPFQRSPVNTEAKLLLMTHAFEQLGCLRVEFKTDSLNQRSRTAIARLGAKEEGTFRNHFIVWDGRLRHSVWFSVIDSEWPSVKERLQTMLLR